MPFFPSSYSETQGSIRDDTALLSDMLLSPSAVPPSIHQLHGGGGSPASISRGRLPPSPSSARPPQHHQPPSWTSPFFNATAHLSRSQHLENSGSEGDDTPRTMTTPPAASATSHATKSSSPSSISAGRSILTMLLERERNDSTASDTTVIAREASTSVTAGSPPHPPSDTTATVNHHKLNASSSEGAETRTTPPSLSSLDFSQEEVPTPRAIPTGSPPPRSQGAFPFPSTTIVHPHSSSASEVLTDDIGSGGVSPRRARRLSVTSSSSQQRCRIPDEESGTAPLLGGQDKPLRHNYDTFHTHNGNGNGGASSPLSSSSPPHHAYTSPPHPGIVPTSSSSALLASGQVTELLHTAVQYASPKAFKTGIVTTLETLPAVLLGLLLNILDGVSYGFIIFPAGPVFAGFGSMGVSMFFVTCVSIYISS